jgi:hypothetical protein
MISALTGEKAWPRQAHGWHRRHRERDPARADASMPSDDHTVVGNQHWIVEAEALDRRCDLLDLTFSRFGRVPRPTAGGDGGRSSSSSRK